MTDHRLESSEGSNHPRAEDHSRLNIDGSSTTGTVISGEQDPLDRLAEEFVDRCRRGESPTVAEYEARFPDQAEKIRKLLGAVAMMEQLRRGSRQARFMPERIGEFRVLRELGRGGMGVVYEAVQESLWRHVAVKAIHHTQLDMKRLQRFQREAQAVAQLHHTNIVPIFGVGEHDGIPYYAMQYIKGKGLDALLEAWRQDEVLPKADRWRIAARFASQTAEALGYAHEQGVLHRDIKPANLLIDEHDAVWVTDFGLAKMVGHEELTASGDVIGTLRYLAPESLRGISEGRSDVYSLGLTLYEMLTLTPPFGDLTPSELLHQVSEGQPVRPRQVDPTIPLDLETIVLKATARDLKDRYATAKDLADDLHSFLDDRPIQARRANFIERSWRWSRRNRATAALSALAVASLFLAAVVGWVGYVRTTNALAAASKNLKKSDENFSVLQSLYLDAFDKFFPVDEVEPEEERPLTQPLFATSKRTGGSLLFTDPVGGPGPGPEFGGFRDGGPGPGPGDEGPPGFRGHPGGPRDLPPGRNESGRLSGDFGPFNHEPRGNETTKLELLKTLMTSYDRFASSAENMTNPRLQSEAAWVYFKMAKLSRRFKDRTGAEQSFDRALQIFDDLSIKHSQSPDYFHKLFQICGSINPWQDDPLMLATVEQKLKRMEVSVGRLLTASPGGVEYLRARMQLLAKLGLVRYQLLQPDAEATFQQAIDLADLLIVRSPEEGYPHSDRSDVLEAYGMVLVNQGKTAAARQRFEAAMADLEWVADDGLKSLSVASRMESLADDFENIGDQTRSDQIQERADQIDPRRPAPNRPKPGRPFGPRRLDPGPAGDELGVD